MAKPMAPLRILQYPDTRLRTRAQPVDAVTDDVRQLVADMFATMYAAPGVGLAASQVDVHKRIIVVDVSKERNEPHAFINPEIEIIGGTQLLEEGCLSVPGFFEAVSRVDRIRVAALNEHGESFALEADGFLSVCIQHECDHLEGKLFVDRLSSLKRSRIRKKLAKQQREDVRR